MGLDAWKRVFEGADQPANITLTSYLTLTLAWPLLLT